jgi:outer membrane protein
LIDSAQPTPMVRRKQRVTTNLLWVASVLLFASVPLAAQESAPAGPQQNATSPASAAAPAQTVTSPAETQQPSTEPQQPEVPAPPAISPSPQLPTRGPLRKLTLQDAEALAIKNNPQISVYHLIYLASNEMTREAKSAYYPSINGNLTAVGSQQGSRIAAGALNAPRLLNRAAGGLVLSQLITDFGRTNNLVAMSALRAKAANMNAVATAYEIKLAVDEAFYNALLTFAEQRVAEQTVSERKLVSDQITTLYQNKLRSEVDVSFADANLAQAELLLLDGQNNYQAALSQLSQVLGYSGQQQFDLVDTEAEIKPPPDAVSALEDEAFSNRPEIASQTYEYQADQHFQKAERDLLFPTVSALGVVGDAFNGSVLDGVQQFPTWYGAAGANVSVPIFNGFQYLARSKEASLRAQAADEQLRDLKDRIANDVRNSWLNAITAYHRIDVSQQFLKETNLAFNLSQTRYNLGLSSIVELSQAQLQQTQAEIQFAASKYQYRIAQSVLRFQIAAP